MSVSPRSAPPAATPSPSPSPSPHTSGALARVPGFVQVLADFLGVDARALSVPAIVNDDGGRSSAPKQLLTLEADIQRCTAGLPTDALDVLAFRHLWCEASGRGFSINHLIVTIPDPIRSRLSLNFDRNLDAIQRAMATAGYGLDRFDLPWSEDTGDGRDKARPSRFETEPGALLFRKDGKDADARALLIVLLIGETPTGGVHRLALRKALELVYAAESSGCGSEKPSPVPLRILGPSFTGAAPSLSSTLAAWRNCGRTASFEVIAGSATAIDEDAFRADLLSRDSVTAASSEEQPARDSFHATINKDQPWQLPKLLGVDAGQVAFLTESNTGFGGAIRRELRQRPEPSPSPSATPSPSASPSPGPSPSPSPKGTTSTSRTLPLRLTFPLSISQVRSAYEKQRRARAPASDQETPSALPLFLDEATDSSDVPAPYSSLSTHSTELVLSRLLDTIAREDVRFVVLLATDVRDTLFLAREVRNHCPNTSLVTLEADLLYLHPDVIRWTEGMLVLTPYPLASWPQALADPGRRRARLQFPSSTTEGVFNAAVSFVRPSDRLDYAPPPLDVSPGPPQASPDLPTPPLWWAVVSRSGFQPLRYLPDGASRGYLRGGEPPPPHSGRRASLGTSIHSESRVAFEFAVFLASGILAGAYLTTRLAGASSSRPGWAGDVFGNAIDPSAQAERWLYQMALVVSLSSFGLVAAVIYLTPLWFRGGSAVVWETSASEWLPIFLVAALYVAVASMASWQALGPGSGSRRWSLRFLACVAVGGVAASLVTLWKWHSAKPFVLRHALAALALGTLVACFLESPLRRALSRVRPTAPAGTPSRNGDVGLGTIGPILVAMLLIAGLSFVYARELHRQTPFEAFAFYSRGADPSSGVSPLVPLLLVSLCACLWALGSLRRLRLHERLQGSAFLGFARARSAGLERRVFEVVARVGAGAARLPAAPIVLLLLAAASYRLLWNRSLAPPFEPSSFNALFSVAFFFIYFAIVLMFLRFVSVWLAFSRFLRAVALYPLGDALRALRPRLSWIPFLELTGPAPKFAALGVGVELAEAVERDLDACWKALGASRLPGPTRPAAYLPAARTALDQALAADAAGDWAESLRSQNACGTALAETSGLVDVLLAIVARQPPPEDEAAKKAVASWTSSAEQFLASRVAGLAILVISVLRSLIAVVSISVLLVLLAVSWYPFQSKEYLLSFNWTVILAIGAGTLWVFVQMDRDEVLSYLAGSEPGKLNLNRDFLLRILTYGAIPLMTMLAAQFPGAGGQISAWIQRLLGGAH